MQNLIYDMTNLSKIKAITYLLKANFQWYLKMQNIFKVVMPKIIRFHIIFNQVLEQTLLFLLSNFSNINAYHTQINTYRIEILHARELYCT